VRESDPRIGTVERTMAAGGRIGARGLGSQSAVRLQIFQN